MLISYKKSVAATFAALLLLAVLFTLTSCNFAADRSYGVIETYRIISAEGSRAHLMVDLPVSYGYQRVDSPTVNNADEYHFEEKDGYQILHAEIIGDGNERTVEIAYNVELLSGELTWDMDVRDEYLEPYGNVDSDHATIIEAVHPLIVENDDYQTAKNISAFVTKTVKSDTSTKINSKTLPASEILRQKKGVCNDYANLTAAMLRAAGIPSRPVSGLVYNDLRKAEDWSHSAGGGSHAWVEFYADGMWHFADTTWGNSYFDKPDGYHLSYGTELVDISTDEYKAYFDEMAKGMQDNGYKLIASMTAPLKFTVCSNDPDAMVIPKAVVERLADKN